MARQDRRIDWLHRQPWPLLWSLASVSLACPHHRGLPIGHLGKRELGYPTYSSRAGQSLSESLSEERGRRVSVPGGPRDREGGSRRGLWEWIKGAIDVPGGNRWPK